MGSPFRGREKKFEDISKAYKFPDVAEFSQEERKNSLIDIGGSYWQRFEKKDKRFKF